MTPLDNSENTRGGDAGDQIAEAAVSGEETNEVDAESVGVSAILKIRDFRFALISGAILVFGFEMRAIAQSWLALELTDSQAWVGAVNGLPAIAMIALSLLGGVAADRFPKRNVLLVVRLLMVSIGLVVGYLVAVDAITIWALLGLAVVQGGIAAFGLPANQSLVIELVGRDNVLTATSLVQTLAGLSLVLGPALGGFVLGMWGVAPVYFFVAAIHAVAGIGILMVRNRKVHRSDESKSAMAEIREGLRFVRGNPLVQMLMVLNVLGIFAGFMFPLIPVYARDVLDVGETGYGMLMGAFGLGGVAGTIILVTIGNMEKRGRVVIAAGVIWLIGTFVFAFSRNYYLSLVTMVVMGAGGIGYVTTINAMVQIAIPDELRGRVTSLFSITMQLFPLGFFAGGLLAATTSNEIAMMVSGVGTALPVVLVYAGSRQFRAMT
jgi:MFS family permease